MKFTKAKEVYEKKYKTLIIIPFMILLLSVSFLGYQKITTGEFISKDISITGGTQIIVQVPELVNDIVKVEEKIQEITGSSVSVRLLRGVSSGNELSYSIEMESGFSKEEILNAIQTSMDVELTDNQYSISETSPALGDSFWTSAIKALILAFIFMSLVVFYYFRSPIPALAVVLAAVSNIIGAIAITNLLGLKLSTGGVAALLMLIGYSVDTNILLTTKMLKNRIGDLMSRVYSAAKTGLTMQIIAIIAMLIMLILSSAQVLQQIAIVLLAGLLLDIVNTWIQNTAILRWYLEKKHG